MSRIIVIGGTGLIGSKVVQKLLDHGHEAIPASPNSGVDTITGEGLDQVLEGASTVLDVSNSPSFADEDVMKFFTTSTTNIIAAAKKAGVGHYVALSVVGSDRMTDSGYMRAKVAQEKLITSSGIPYSLVHATQFFEFVTSIADAATVGDEVRLSHAQIRPMAAEDVATSVAQVTAHDPLNGILEVGGQSSSGSTTWSAPDWRSGATRARSSPTPTRHTSGSGSPKTCSCPGRARRSSGRDSRTGCQTTRRRHPTPLAETRIRLS